MNRFLCAMIIAFLLVSSVASQSVIRSTAASSMASGIEYREIKNGFEVNGVRATRIDTDARIAVASTDQAYRLELTAYTPVAFSKGKAVDSELQVFLDKYEAAFSRVKEWVEMTTDPQVPSGAVRPVRYRLLSVPSDPVRWDEKLVSLEGDNNIVTGGGLFQGGVAIDVLRQHNTTRAVILQSVTLTDKDGVHSLDSSFLLVIDPPSGKKPSRIELYKLPALTTLLASAQKR